MTNAVREQTSPDVQLVLDRIRFGAEAALSCYRNLGILAGYDLVRDHLLAIVEELDDLEEEEPDSTPPPASEAAPEGIVARLWHGIRRDLPAHRRAIAQEASDAADDAIERARRSTPPQSEPQ